MRGDHRSRSCLGLDIGVARMGRVGKAESAVADGLSCSEVALKAFYTDRLDAAAASLADAERRQAASAEAATVSARGLPQVCPRCLHRCPSRNGDPAPAICTTSL